MPKGKKTQRCLPAAKARSLTKKQRAATSRKKTASNKQFVKNTKAAKVKIKKMRDLKELTNMVEKLCKKGQAYRAKRMRAGEKSSAYLSGRAVKVCKGQMQGENADPDGDDITIDPDTNFKLDLKHLLKKHIVDDGED